MTWLRTPRKPSLKIIGRPIAFTVLIMWKLIIFTVLIMWKSNVFTVLTRLCFTCIKDGSPYSNSNNKKQKYKYATLEKGKKIPQNNKNIITFKRIWENQAKCKESRWNQITANKTKFNEMMKGFNVSNANCFYKIY